MKFRAFLEAEKQTPYGRTINPVNLQWGNQGLHHPWQWSDMTSFRQDMQNRSQWEQKKTAVQRMADLINAVLTAPEAWEVDFNRSKIDMSRPLESIIYIPEHRLVYDESIQADNRLNATQYRALKQYKVIEDAGDYAIIYVDRVNNLLTQMHKADRDFNVAATGVGNAWSQATQGGLALSQSLSHK